MGPHNNADVYIYICTDSSDMRKYMYVWFMNSDARIYIIMQSIVFVSRKISVNNCDPLHRVSQTSEIPRILSLLFECKVEMDRGVEAVRRDRGWTRRSVWRPGELAPTKWPGHTTLSPCCCLCKRVGDYLGQTGHEGQSVSTCRLRRSLCPLCIFCVSICLAICSFIAMLFVMQTTRHSLSGLLPKHLNFYLSQTLGRTETWT